MSSNSSSLLNIGISGLNVSKKSLETTGHNIANVNTKGFSKQTVKQAPLRSQMQNSYSQGRGVFLKSIERNHDPYIEKRLNASISEHEYHNESVNLLGRVEDVFSEIDRTGLNQIINKFFNSFRDLANNPESANLKSILKNNAKLVTEDINRIDQKLNELNADVGAHIKSEILNVNTTLDSIAGLNKKILSAESSGESANNLRDTRDAAVRELSKSLEVYTYSDKNNNFSIIAQGIGTLLSGGITQHLDVNSVQGNDHSLNKEKGFEEVFF